MGDEGLEVVFEEVVKDDADGLDKLVGDLRAGISSSSRFVRIRGYSRYLTVFSGRMTVDDILAAMTSTCR